MREMERALPPATLREKLPRFLQKCAQEFQADARYRDDPRYLRVWIQLVNALSLCPCASLWVIGSGLWDFSLFISDQSPESALVVQ
jgi:hypothetical protein